MRSDVSPETMRDTRVDGSVLTFVDLMEKHAAERGQSLALAFLQDGVRESDALTYAALHLRARSIAAWLQSQELERQRVLLLFPSGLEFVASLLGCFYAGVIAVPVNPPRLNRKAHRLRSVVEDSQAALALTTSRMQERIRPALAEAGMATLALTPVDSLPDELASQWQRPAVDGESVAFLQYTSGSTSHPKGVMVSHRNLLANHRMMQEAFSQTSERRIVTWLPLFHDMGLIGNVLQALYLGTECAILPPEVFLMKPVCWLEAIARRRATFSGAPNFAYELCAQKVTEVQRQGLDLSCWETAFAGAEPVRHTTMEKFAAAFAACGFQKQALYPCYGLAEATLFVSGAGKLAGARSTRFSTAELENHRAVAVTDPDTEAKGDASVSTRVLVSCGHSWPKQQIEIVDSATGERCPPGAIGEIWISGPHVAQGYWDRGLKSTRGFDALLPDKDGTTFLRTGDLGFLHEGGLYICGRIKDLIIIGGRNHDPGDIEQTVGVSHPAIRPSGCVAFQVDLQDEARLVVAVELERTSGVSFGDEVAGGEERHASGELTASKVIRAIREAIASHHDLAVHEIVLMRPAALPKTSSGKIQRHAARIMWLEHTLQRWEPRT